MGIPFVSAMYPVGMTPRHGVHRIIPNHYLDLATWQCERQAPSRDLADTYPVEESVARIAELTRNNISALVDAAPCYLPTTAG